MINRYLILPAILLCSCSTIDLSGRAGKDLAISEKSSELFQGRFILHDGLTLAFNIAGMDVARLAYDSAELDAEFIPVTRKRLAFRLIKNDSVYFSKLIKGQFVKGYFRTKRSWHSDGVAGPFFWILGEQFAYIGITRERDLVVVDSGGFGTAFFIIMPFFVHGKEQSESIYKLKL